MPLGRDKVNDNNYHCLIITSDQSRATAQTTMDNNLKVFMPIRGESPVYMEKVIIGIRYQQALKGIILRIWRM